MFFAADAFPDIFFVNGHLFDQIYSRQAGRSFGFFDQAFLVQVFGGMASSPAWVTKLSPFSHIAPVPASPVDGAAMVVMLSGALISTALGVLAFSRRDIA